jgi:hypothetical protein
MPLTGLQHQQIQDAVLAAFDEAGLRQLVRQELDADLDAVAGGKNKTEVILHPAPDLQARLEELGFSDPYGEYRWQVRLVDVEAPLVHRHGATWGPESTFVIAP